jgi:Fe-Mn family superoxide dismutase
LSPTVTTPDASLLAQVERDFGSQARLGDVLTATCTGVHGSGWGALAYDSPTRRLRVVGLHDHQADLVPNTSILAVIDVWEHAYYLGYRNDRAAWVAAVIEHLNWPNIATAFAACQPAPALVG